MSLIARPRIISDGTANGTYFFDAAGNLVDPQYTKLTWTLDKNSGLGTAQMHFELVRVDVYADLNQALGDMEREAAEGENVTASSPSWYTTNETSGATYAGPMVNRPISAAEAARRAADGLRDQLGANPANDFGNDFALASPSPTVTVEEATTDAGIQMLNDLSRALGDYGHVVEGSFTS